MPLSINKSLPATPIAGVNICLQFPSISNLVMNAKLEQLESKLCGKTMAMKSYVKDEIWSFKNKTVQASRNNNSVNIIEGKTALENKIKLL